MTYEQSCKNIPNNNKHPIPIDNLFEFLKLAYVDVVESERKLWGSQISV